MTFKEAIIRIILTLILTGLPFSSALGAQHALAHVAPENHSHSGFDLCEWLQVLSTGSLNLDKDPFAQGLGLSGERVVQVCSFFKNQPLVSSHRPRAPPYHTLHNFNQ